MWLPIGPMLMLIGASGSGKSAVLAHLGRLLPGVVVIDMDEMLWDGSRLAGVDLTLQSASVRWPAYNDLCLRSALSVLRAGHTVLMLSPLTPGEVEGSAVAPLLGSIRWAVLDCADASRRDRLAARLDGSQVDEALEDAAFLRSLGLPVLSSDTASVESTAQVVAEWASKCVTGH